MTLDGQGFCGLVAVTIGGAPVSNLNVVSSLLLTFDTPPGTSGQAADVAVVADGGSSALAGGFLYLDATPPLLTQPPDIFNVPALDANGAVVMYALPTATDNDDPNPVVSCAPASGSLFPLGSTTVTCTATDAVGNTSTVTFIVDVVDATPPAVVCPAPSQVVADAITGQAPIPDLLGAVLATDNVTPSGAIVLSQSPAAGALLGVGVHTVTVTATDGAGNSHTCTTTVEVVDVTPPVIGPTVNHSEVATGEFTTVVYLEPVATDNADPSPAVDCVPPPGSSFPVGFTTVTCTATDAGGNSSAPAILLVEVVDLTPPVVGPTVNHSEVATGEFTTVVYLEPVATDDADPNPAVTCVPLPGASFPVGFTTVTCTATDASGNPSVPATLTVEVVDPTPPVLGPTINHTELATGPLTPVVYTPPVATDNADPSPVVTCVPPPGSSFPVGFTTVTCTATDASGNPSVPATLTVEVVDPTPPVLGPTTNHTELATGPSTPVVYTLPVATDNADPNPVVTCVPAPGSSFPVGFTTVTCTATDASGNPSAPATLTVEVVDSSPPVLGPTVNHTEVATGEFTPVVYLAPVATDDTDPNPIVTCVPPPGASFPVGFTTVTCTATDASGNPSAPATLTVEVVDSSPPVLGPTVNHTEVATGEFTPVVYLAPVATDDTDPNPIVTCVPPPGASFPVGFTTVTCTATDASGNPSAPATLTVEVVDTNPPSLLLPAVQAVAATSPAGALVTYNAEATDIADPSPTVVCVPPSGSVFPIGTTAVTCTATDASENEATGSFNVIVLGADDQVDNLLQDVIDSGAGPGGSMASKLEGVVSSLAKGNENSACGQLSALANQVNAQAGKQLTQAEAAQLLATIQQIQSVLGCN